MSLLADQLDRDVRMHIYSQFVDSGRAPEVADTAVGLRLNEAEVGEAFQRLADTHVIVLEPGTLTVRMANPLSAIETPFKVRARNRNWFGNCIWDSLGVVAMLGGNGSVETTCGCCDEAMRVDVEDYRVPGAATGLVHFGVPARQWWDNIIHT